MMSINTRGRYAARIMVCLAKHDCAVPMSKFEIGAQESVSTDYVEQIMIRLKAAHLVRSHRGRNGGFSLTRDPYRITLAEVLQAVDGPVSPVPCLYDTCERESSCPTRPVWKKAAEAVDAVFSKATIGEMAGESGFVANGVGSYQI